MKKQMKKLVISKETVRSLTASRLGPAVGGWWPSAWLGCTNETTETSQRCGTGLCGSATCEGTCLCNSNEWECVGG